MNSFYFWVCFSQLTYVQDIEMRHLFTSILIVQLLRTKLRINRSGNRVKTGQNNSTTFDNVSVLVCGTDYPTPAQTDDKVELCYRKCDFERKFTRKRNRKLEDH